MRFIRHTKIGIKEFVECYDSDTYSRAERKSSILDVVFALELYCKAGDENIFKLEQNELYKILRMIHEDLFENFDSMNITDQSSLIEMSISFFESVQKKTGKMVTNEMFFKVCKDEYIELVNRFKGIAVETIHDKNIKKRILSTQPKHCVYYSND